MPQTAHLPRLLCSMGMTLHEAPAPADIKSCYTVIFDGRVIGRVDMDLAPSLVNRLRMLKVLGQEKVHHGCFTIYKTFSGKSGWKVNGTRLFGSFRPGA